MLKFELHDERQPLKEDYTPAGWIKLVYKLLPVLRGGDGYRRRLNESVAVSIRYFIETAHRDAKPISIPSTNNVRTL